MKYLMMMMMMMAMFGVSCGEDTVTTTGGSGVETLQAGCGDDGYTDIDGVCVEDTPDPLVCDDGYTDLDGVCVEDTPSTVTVQCDSTGSPENSRSLILDHEILEGDPVPMCEWVCDNPFIHTTYEDGSVGCSLKHGRCASDEQCDPTNGWVNTCNEDFRCEKCVGIGCVLRCNTNTDCGWGYRCSTSNPDYSYSQDEGLYECVR